jgi:hypothetical protein
MSTVTINESQRLFVIPSGGGYSCLGFDVVFKRLRQYAEMLGLAQPYPTEVGKMEQYQQYLQAERAYIASNPTETLYDPETPVKVRALLEAYRKSGDRVRLYLGDPRTGRAWLEEHDVLGRIDRSMGPIKVPLLVEAGEHGGGAILTECIVRILDARSKAEVYRHPTYHEPELALRRCTQKTHPYEVLADGAVHARFKTQAKAQAWVDFMQGRRMTK